MVNIDVSIIPRGGRVLAAVSGGADSMSLMHLLHALRHDRGVELIVVHYDHALRSGSSKDMMFVEEAAAGLGLKCITERNTSRPPSGSSIEEFARQQRFSFFVRTAKRLKADAVVLAHTQDVCRGSFF
jgi:tRNA(Ile)-lysidine synthase